MCRPLVIALPVKVGRVAESVGEEAEELASAAQGAGRDLLASAIVASLQSFFHLSRVGFAVLSVKVTD